MPEMKQSGSNSSLETHASPRDAAAMQHASTSASQASPSEGPSPHSLRAQLERAADGLSADSEAARSQTTRSPAPFIETVLAIVALAKENPTIANGFDHQRVRALAEEQDSGTPTPTAADAEDSLVSSASMPADPHKGDVDPPVSAHWQSARMHENGANLVGMPDLQQAYSHLSNRAQSDIEHSYLYNRPRPDIEQWAAASKLAALETITNGSSTERRLLHDLFPAYSSSAPFPFAAGSSPWKTPPSSNGCKSQQESPYEPRLRESRRHNHPSRVLTSALEALTQADAAIRKARLAFSEVLDAVEPGPVCLECLQNMRNRCKPWETKVSLSSLVNGSFSGPCSPSTDSRSKESQPGAKHVHHEASSDGMEHGARGIARTATGLSSTARRGELPRRIRKGRRDLRLNVPLPSHNMDLIRAENLRREQPPSRWSIDSSEEAANEVARRLPPEQPSDQKAPSSESPTAEGPIYDVAPPSTYSGAEQPTDPVMIRSTSSAGSSSAGLNAELSRFDENDGEHSAVRFQRDVSSLMQFYDEILTVLPVQNFGSPETYLRTDRAARIQVVDLDTTAMSLEDVLEDVSRSSHSVRGTQQPALGRISEELELEDEEQWASTIQSHETPNDRYSDVRAESEMTARRRGSGGSQWSAVGSAQDDNDDEPRSPLGHHTLPEGELCESCRLAAQQITEEAILALGPFASDEQKEEQLLLASHGISDSTMLQLSSQYRHEEAAVHHHQRPYHESGLSRTGSSTSTPRVPVRTSSRADEEPCAHPCDMLRTKDSRLRQSLSPRPEQGLKGDVAEAEELVEAAGEPAQSNKKPKSNLTGSAPGKARLAQSPTEKSTSEARRWSSASEIPPVPADLKRLRQQAGGGRQGSHLISSGRATAASDSSSGGFVTPPTSLSARPSLELQSLQAPPRPPRPPIALCASLTDLRTSMDRTSSPLLGPGRSVSLPMSAPALVEGETAVATSPEQPISDMHRANRASQTERRLSKWLTRRLSRMQQAPQSSDAQQSGADGKRALASHHDSQWPRGSIDSISPIAADRDGGPPDLSVEAVKRALAKSILERALHRRSRTQSSLSLDDLQTSAANRESDFEGTGELIPDACSVGSIEIDDIEELLIGTSGKTSPELRGYDPAASLQLLLAARKSSQPAEPAEMSALSPKQISSPLQALLAIGDNLQPGRRSQDSQARLSSIIEDEGKLPVLLDVDRYEATYGPLEEHDPLKDMFVEAPGDSRPSCLFSLPPVLQTVQDGDFARAHEVEDLRLSCDIGITSGLVSSSLDSPTGEGMGQLPQLASTVMLQSVGSSLSMQTMSGGECDPGSSSGNAPRKSQSGSSTRSLRLPELQGRRHSDSISERRRPTKLLLTPNAIGGIPVVLPGPEQPPTTTTASSGIRKAVPPSPVLVASGGGETPAISVPSSPLLEAQPGPDMKHSRLLSALKEGKALRKLTLQPRNSRLLTNLSKRAPDKDGIAKHSPRMRHGAEADGGPVREKSPRPSISRLSFSTEGLGRSASLRTPLLPGEPRLRTRTTLLSTDAITIISHDDVGPDDAVARDVDATSQGAEGTSSSMASSAALPWFKSGPALPPVLHSPDLPNATPNAAAAAQTVLAWPGSGRARLVSSPITVGSPIKMPAPTLARTDRSLPPCETPMRGRSSLDYTARPRL
ncbi:unnamed protein product [Parajaminaea phylloscopi]